MDDTVMPVSELDEASLWRRTFHTCGRPVQKEPIGLGRRSRVVRPHAIYKHVSASRGQRFCCRLFLPSHSMSCAVYHLMAHLREAPDHLICVLWLAELTPGTSLYHIRGWLSIMACSGEGNLSRRNCLLLLPCREAGRLSMRAPPQPAGYRKLFTRASK